MAALFLFRWPHELGHADPNWFPLVGDADFVTSRLQSLADMLRADGYDLRVEAAPGGVSVAIDAGPEACADCLAPEQIVRAMIEDKLEGSVAVVEITYPATGAAR